MAKVHVLLRLAKALADVKASKHSEQYSVQYAVLFQLRELKHNAGVDDSDYIHVLHYVELELDNIADITSDELARLKYIRTGLSYLLRKRAVPPSTMRKALDDEQHAEYVRSFDMDISHVETEDGCGDAMPIQLIDYMDMVRKGDKYTRIANLFKKKRRVVSALGKSAYTKYDTLAEGCYEEAVMDLCNMLETDTKKSPYVDYKLIGEISRWLDRPVDTRLGYAPDITQEGVPRVKGSRSKFSLDFAKPVVGTKLRKYWRQRNALVDAALPLIYAEKELNDDEIAEMKEANARTRQKLQQFLKLAEND